MLIRDMQPEDMEEVRSIWNEVVRDANAFPQIEPLATNEEASEFFAQQTRSAVAVDEDGAVLGLYILHPNNIGRCGHVANASYAVSSAARGRGIGRALVENSIDSLAPCGFTGLQFNAVVASNLSAIALYEKIGFTRVGTIPKGFKNGEGELEDMHIFYHAAR